MNELKNQGHWKGVQDLFEQLHTSGLGATAVHYNTLFAVLGRAKKLDKVFVFFQRMKSAGLSPNLITYNTLIAACSSSGKTDKAMEFFEEMKEVGHVPDVITYSTLIKAFANVGDCDKALEIFEIMNGAVMGGAANGAGQSGQNILFGIKKVGTWSYIGNATRVGEDTWSTGRGGHGRTAKIFGGRLLGRGLSW